MAGKQGFRRRYKQARRELGMLALKTFAPSLLRVLARSWRVEIQGEEHRLAIAERAGYIVWMWHGRMLIGLSLFSDRGGVRVLVSPSRDGDLAQELLLASGFKTLRGSSSRGGANAVREMLGHLDRGEGLVITPDGPRGPRHSTKPGLAWMARTTGFPILPLGMVADRAWHAASWDHFTVPKPRARVVARFGPALAVPPDADDAELARITAELRESTIRLEREAFAHLGVAQDWTDDEVRSKASGSVDGAAARTDGR
jgi:lysophospholipid acyltransferase (LPLAT)-like uncharacterized protein